MFGAEFAGHLFRGQETAFLRRQFAGGGGWFGVFGDARLSMPAKRGFKRKGDTACHAALDLFQQKSARGRPTQAKGESPLAISSAFKKRGETRNWVVRKAFANVVFPAPLQPAKR